MFCSYARRAQDLGSLRQFFAIAALVAPLTTGLPAGAQTVPLPIDPDWSALRANTTQSVAWGDMDGDGDLDLAVGNQDSPNQLYLNLAGQLAFTPAWSSEISEITQSVAWGDVDGDGDLDLACGNVNSPSRVYRNDGVQLTSTPTWSAGLSEYTHSVAWGDVDGDGDLDLACGNVNSPNRVYLNQGGQLAASPNWSATWAEQTMSVAWGDVDNDGDLDLACGSYYFSNLVYLNQGGQLEGTPSWSAQPGNEGTESLAWGDVDADGDLDLACGNGSSPNSLYRNEGGQLEVTPSWTAQNTVGTFSVAWGDVDGDGDLDFACGNMYAANSVYLNTGNGLEATPSWSAQRDESTSSVAWGDVDGDGDLDLASGNVDSPNRLYSNQDGQFITAIAWQVQLDLKCNRLAWGDVDGDGDLDLAFASAGSRNRVHLNLGVQLATVPSWLAEISGDTNDIAWGDVDGDGDLDLACGNSNAPNRLYLNTAGQLSTAPSWSSELSASTQSIAWGDFDGDGDLDLACGNYTSPNRVYINESGQLSMTPGWSATLSEATSSVAWGDMDGDGDLDLACGNYTSPNRVYINEGGQLATTPSWSAALSEKASSIAWGDMDGDGDLDLACGNHDSSSRVYLNAGGQLGATPAWSAQLSAPTMDVAWGDADGDGDLDLALGNPNSPNWLYLNQGVQLATSPSPSATLWEGTTSVAWGDADGDGDLDLACSASGNGYSLNRVFLNERGSMQSAGEGLTFLLNNPTRLRNLRLTQSPSNPNQFEIRYFAEDADSDPFRLRAEYRFQGNSTTYPLAIVGENTSTLGPLPTSPQGTEHSFTWDVLRLPLDPRPVTLLIKVIENPKRGGQILYSATLRKDLERIVPHRPQIALAQSELDFGAVCFGDSNSITLRITNRGNEALDLQPIQVSAAAMTLSPLPPSLAPGVTALATLTLHPRPGPPIPQTLYLSSNDPVTPNAEFQLNVDVQSLGFTLSRLNDRSPWPLAEAIPFLIEPESPWACIDRGTVYYRRPGDVEFASTTLQALGNSFSAIIPGQDVTELSLEYYVEVENSGVFARDPDAAPAELHSLSVASAASIATLAQPNLGSSIAAGLDMSVLIELPEGAQLTRGDLYYREGGATEFQTVPVVAGAIPFALIPGASVGPRGIEYWAQVETRAGTQLQDPALNPLTQPRMVRVTIPKLVEPTVQPARRYRLLGVPLEFPVEFSGTLVDLLGDEKPFGGQDAARWRAFRYVDGSTLEWSEADARFRPEPGRAFWLISSEAHRVDTAPVTGLSLPTDASFSLDLSAGWNQIACPYAFAVAWSAVTRPAGVEDPVAFEPTLDRFGAYSPDEVLVLMPFQGYFVYSAEPAALSFAPQAASDSLLSLVGPLGTRSVVAAAGEKSEQLGFEVQVSLETEAGRAGGITLGTGRHGSGVRDALDQRLRPAIPGTWAQLAVDNRSWREAAGLYSRDIRSDLQAGQRWDLVLRSERAGEPITLRFDVSTAAEALSVRWIDLESGIHGDASQAHTVISRRDREHRFIVLAGSADWIEAQGAAQPELPRTVLLDQNFPNPFNPATLIRYGLPKAADVSLDIYDLRGRKVVSLLENSRQPAGYHSLVWQGTDSSGAPVASGMYLVVLRSAETSLRRKLTLIR